MSLTILILLISVISQTVSGQLLRISSSHRPDPVTPIHTRLDLQRQKQVPAFVITSIDHKWREQSLRTPVDPKEQRVPVLIATKPQYANSRYSVEPAPQPSAVSVSRPQPRQQPTYRSVPQAAHKLQQQQAIRRPNSLHYPANYALPQTLVQRQPQTYQRQAPQPQPTTTTTPTTAAQDYDVTEEEANDPKFRYLYDLLSRQYVNRYEEKVNASYQQSEQPAKSEATTTEEPTTSTTEASTGAPSSTDRSVETLHSYQSVPSYQSVAGVGEEQQHPEYQEMKEHIVAPHPYPHPSAYSQYEQPDVSYSPHKATVPRQYVASDVYTIEKKANYRPRAFHSNAVFYQKALAFLRDYKDVIVTNRHPHGLTYRPNSQSDDPSHVAAAYGELTPIIVKNADVPLIPRQHLRTVQVQQVQHVQEIEHPVAQEEAEYQPKPQPLPSVVSYDDHPIASQYDEDKQLVGFLPVIAMPKGSRVGQSRKPYQSLVQLSHLQSQEEQQPQPQEQEVDPTSNYQQEESASASSKSSKSLVLPSTTGNGGRVPQSGHQPHVPFLRVLRKQQTL